MTFANRVRVVDRFAELVRPWKGERSVIVVLASLAGPVASVALGVWRWTRLVTRLYQGSTLMVSIHDREGGPCGSGVKVSVELTVAVPGARVVMVARSVPSMSVCAAVTDAMAGFELIGTPHRYPAVTVSASVIVPPPRTQTVRNGLSLPG